MTDIAEPETTQAVRALTSFPADASTDDILAAIQRDGACIVTGVLSDEEVDRVNDDVGPWIEASPDGRDDFTGRSTRRTGALAARTPETRPVIMHPLALEIANRFMEPFTNKIQLHLTQTIAIGPGQGRQPLHRDRLAWGGYIPREVEPQLNTMWALTEFTEDNGATRVVPGSVTWPDEQRADPDQVTQAVMPKGSVLFYTGSVIHGGGENRTDEVRIGMNITYCLSWLRTEENQFLSCPPEFAKDLDPALQDLLGYTMGNYALGYYSSPDGAFPDGMAPKSDLVPPETLMGRRPTERNSYESTQG